MIAIRINRKHWLQLPGDIELDINRVSPVFSEDKVFEQNSVYNFTVPYTPANAEALGYPNRAMALMPPTGPKTIEIFFINNLVASGTAYVTKCKRNSIEITAGLDSSSFYALFGDKYITEFSYGGELYYNGNYTSDAGSVFNIPKKLYPEVPFAYFPVYNESLYDGSNLETKYRNIGLDPLFVNLNRPYQNDFMSLWASNDPDYYAGNAYSVTPFPYVARIMQGVFEESGYSINRNDFAKDNALARLCIYNPNIAPHVFASLTNHFYIHLAEHLPKMKVAEFLAAFKKPFALNFFVNENIQTVDIVQFNNRSDQREVMAGYYDGDEFTSTKSVKYKMPVDSGDTFANIWQQPDELEKHRYRGQVIVFNDLVSITNPIKGDIALVFDDNYFYLYDQDSNQNYIWERFAYNVKNSTYGEGEEVSSVELGFTTSFNVPTTVKNLTGSGWEDDSWSIPHVEMAGNIKNGAIAPQTPYNDFGLKIMSYFGMEKTETFGFDYPIGSGGIYKYNNTRINTNPIPALSLFPNQDRNFVDKYLLAFHETLKNRRVRKISKRMMISELKEIDFLRTYHIDGRLWTLSKVNFKLSNRGVSPVEIELTEIS